MRDVKRTALITGLVVSFGALAFVGAPTAAQAQNGTASAAPLTRAQLDELRQTLERHMRQERGRLAGLQRQVDEVTLYMRVQDLAHVDELSFFGPPAGSSESPRPISAFVFVPKSMSGNQWGSLVVWQRGAGSLELDSWADVPELRELLGRGVTVIAPAYQGGPEERLDAVTEYALDRFPHLDAGRIRWRAPS